MKAQITLKSGAQVTVEVDKITTRPGPDGGVAGLEWVTPKGATAKLHHIDPGQIAAIVILRRWGR